MANRITVTWEGREDVEEALRELPERVERGTWVGLQAVAMLLQNECRRMLQRGPKSGRVYRRGASGIHQASAPGEAPATDTGTLVRSVLGEADQAEMEATLSAEAEYARYLELGTRHMWPRPFLKPTLVKVRRRALEILRAAIKEELGRG